MTGYPHYERPHVAAEGRYDTIGYRRTGRSGLDLPAFSFGLWQKFGADYAFDTQREIILRAFDLGITHFDNADRYGPPHRGAQQTFGRVLARELAPYRDELILSTKAGTRSGRALTCGAVPARILLRPWTTACVTSAPTTSTSSTTTPRPDDAVGGDGRRPGRMRAIGQGAVHRHLQLPARSHPRRSPICCGRRACRCSSIRPGTRSTTAGPSRTGSAGGGRAGRLRRHRLLPARAGTAHGQVPRDDPRGRPRAPAAIPVSGRDRRDVPAAHGRAEQAGREPRPVAGPARPAVGASPARGDLGADRRELHRATRPQPAGAVVSRPDRRGTGRHRRARCARHRAQARRPARTIG